MDLPVRQHGRYVVRQVRCKDRPVDRHPGHGRAGGGQPLLHGGPRDVRRGKEDPRVLKVAVSGQGFHELLGPEHLGLIVRFDPATTQRASRGPAYRGDADPAQRPGIQALVIQAGEKRLHGVPAGEHHVIETGEFGQRGIRCRPVFRRFDPYQRRFHRLRAVADEQLRQLAGLVPGARDQRADAE